MAEKLIVGISSSPRKNANTDFILKKALAAAEGVSAGIKTKAVFLREYDISPCSSCFACCNETAAKGGGNRPCLYYKDGMDEIYPLLKACSGLILASPVYFGSLNAQMKIFMDRTEGLLRYGMSRYANSLRYKVGAGLAVGGNRNAGQEFSLQQMHYFFHIHDMHVVGSGSVFRPGCYLGGGVTTHPLRGHDPKAAEEDELGIKSAEHTGKRVAYAVGMIRGI